MTAAPDQRTAPPATPAGAHTPYAAPAAAWLGTLLALGVVALGVIGIRDGIAAAGWIRGRLWTAAAVEWFDGLSAAGWMVPAGMAVVLVGLAFVVVAVKPRRRTAVQVSARSSMFLGVGDTGRIADAAARTVPGVLDTRTRATRRTISVRAAVTGGGAAERGRDIEQAVLIALSPLASPPRVKVRCTVGAAQ